MIHSASTTRILKLLLLQVLLLAIVVFSCNALGHAGVDEEIQRLTLLIRQDPVNPQLYLQRGNLYRIHQDWNLALEDFHKAQQHDATATAAEIGLGRTQLMQGSPQQALTHLNRALARQPGNVRALVTRAETYRAMGKPLAAAVDYSRAIEHFPAPGKPLPEYYLERARAYAAAGAAHMEEALQGLDEGIKVLGNIQTLTLYAVELETERGNFDAAFIRLDPLIARANRKEFLLLDRGDILFAAHRYQEARLDYLAAQAAVAALPPRHRQTRSVQQLETILATQLLMAEQQDDNEQ